MKQLPTKINYSPKKGEFYSEVNTLWKHHSCVLISLAMFWASRADPYRPLLASPAQYKPFFPFQ